MLSDEAYSARQVVGRTPPPLTRGRGGQSYQLPGVRRVDRCQALSLITLGRCRIRQLINHSES